MSEKETLMKQLNEASFALDEAVLFLDTHPCDEEALKAYQEKFGPLQKDQVEACEHWHWIHEPWPWEKGGNC